MTEPKDPTHEGVDDDSGLTGMLGRAGAAALRPVRKVAGAGKDVLNDEAERAIDGVMAGPLPEAIGRSVIQHRVVERVVTSALETNSAGAGTAGPAVDTAQVEQALRRVLENPALERMLTETIHSELTAQIADQVVQSPAFKRTLRDVLSSPEVRHALERQATGSAPTSPPPRDATHGRSTVSLESSVRRLFRLPPADAQRARYGGFGSRGVGFVTDVVLVQVIYVVAGGLIGLITSIFGSLKPTWLAATLAALGGLFVVTAYFVAFWSTVGQTPGMRMMHLRVERSGEAPSVWRSLVRLVGLVLAIIPCFAGFIPVLFDPMRRALQDYMAGTSVVYVEDPEPAPDPGAEPSPEPAV